MLPPSSLPDPGKTELAPPKVKTGSLGGVWEGWAPSRPFFRIFHAMEKFSAGFPRHGIRQPPDHTVENSHPAGPVHPPAKSGWNQPSVCGVQRVSPELYWIWPEMFPGTDPFTKSPCRLPGSSHGKPPPHIPLVASLACLRLNHIHHSAVNLFYRL